MSLVDLWVGLGWVEWNIKFPEMFMHVYSEPVDSSTQTFIVKSSLLSYHAHQDCLFDFNKKIDMTY